MAARVPRRQDLSTGASRLPVLAWAVLLAAVIVAVYANGLSGPFVFDDLASIPENPSIQQLWPLHDVLVPPAHGEAVAGRPLVNLTLALNVAVSGLNVRGFHVWNLATHVACGLLLFALLRRLWQRGGKTIIADVDGTTLAWVVAVLWAVHPLQSEAVTYIVARTESTMAFFYLLTLYAVVREQPEAQASPVDYRWRTLAMVSCACGMASKEAMVTVPVMVAAIDRALFYESWSSAWRARRGLYLGLAATWLVLVGLMVGAPRAHSAGFVDGLGTGFETGAWTYLLNQAVMVSRYLRLMAWPVGLVIDYGYPRPYVFADVWLPFLSVAALAVATIVTFVRSPRLGILPLWFFVTLAPSSSVVPIVTEVGAERRMYLPSIAVIVALVLLAKWLLAPGVRGDHDQHARTRVRSVGGALVVIVVTLLAIGTRWRNDEYASPLGLWQTVVDRWPGPRAQANLAAMLYADGRRDEAFGYLQQAAVEMPDARYDLGAQLLVRRRYDDAITTLESFLQARPGHPKQVAAMDLLGQALMRQGRLDDALTQFRAITRLDPTYAVAFGRLGDVLTAQGRVADAVAPLQAYASMTNTANAWRNLGVALATTGQVADAVRAFSREVVLAPADGDAHRNLANALLDQQAFAEAETHAREAVRLKPDDPIAREVLALAQAGRRARQGS